MPRPHKHLCGRPLDEDFLKPAVKVKRPFKGTVEEMLDQAMDEYHFPAPGPSFQRHPALLWQISELKENGGHYIVRVVISYC